MALLESSSVLDVIENFYNDDIRSVARRFRDEISRSYEEAPKNLRFNDFLETYFETWDDPLQERRKSGEPLLPKLTDGELRLAVAPTPLDVIEGYYTPLHAPSKFGIVTWAHSDRNAWSEVILLPAVRRSLLYAHSITLDCQLADYALGQGRITATSDWLHILAELESLIKARVVWVTPTPNLTAYPIRQRQSIISSSAGLDPGTLRRSKQAEFYPFVYRAWMITTAGRYNYTRGRMSLESPPDPTDIDHLIRSIQEWKKDELDSPSVDPDAEDSEAGLELSTLGTFDLPGLSRLSWKDYVRIRSDDSFTEFRVLLRDALRESVNPRTGDVSQSNFKERMVESQRSLERQIKSPSLGKITIPKVVSWSVSALVGWTTAGWPGALASMAVTSGIEYAHSRHPVSQRALLAHVVALRDQRPDQDPNESPVKGS
jgi:hypothetical protein